ncbi:hypothetical protein [Bacillus thuringiensis]|uniref:Uncharacterized protein n=1 Tax=Bacillus thuringiensis TaxID=1428 RepID=A0A9X6WGZ4_BACTU|nr:hypothetical protein [Bacillus thuringiensis]PFJ29368.1 hypothetical protein COJ15_31760 [Bacillus thuringiensis]
MLLELTAMILFMFVMIANFFATTVVSVVHFKFFRKANVTSSMSYILSGVLALVGFIGGLFVMTAIQKPVNNLVLGEYTKFFILTTTLLLVTILPTVISFGTYKLKTEK